MNWLSSIALTASTALGLSSTPDPKDEEIIARYKRNSLLLSEADLRYLKTTNDAAGQAFYKEFMDKVQAFREKLTHSAAPSALATPSALAQTKKIGLADTKIRRGPVRQSAVNPYKGKDKILSNYYVLSEKYIYALNYEQYIGCVGTKTDFKRVSKTGYDYVLQEYQILSSKYIDALTRINRCYDEIIDELNSMYKCLVALEFPQLTDEEKIFNKLTIESLYDFYIASPTYCVIYEATNDAFLSIFHGIKQEVFRKADNGYWAKAGRNFYTGLSGDGLSTKKHTPFKYIGRELPLLRQREFRFTPTVPSVPCTVVSWGVDECVAHPFIKSYVAQLTGDTHAFSMVQWQVTTTMDVDKRFLHDILGVKPKNTTRPYAFDHLDKEPRKEPISKFNDALVYVSTALLKHDLITDSILFITIYLNSDVTGSIYTGGTPMLCMIVLPPSLRVIKTSTTIDVTANDQATPAYKLFQNLMEYKLNKRRLGSYPTPLPPPQVFPKEFLNIGLEIFDNSRLFVVMSLFGIDYNETDEIGNSKLKPNVSSCAAIKKDNLNTINSAKEFVPKTPSECNQFYTARLAQDLQYFPLNKYIGAAFGGSRKKKTAKCPSKKRRLRVLDPL